MLGKSILDAYIQPPIHLFSVCCNMGEKLISLKKNEFFSCFFQPTQMRLHLRGIHIVVRINCENGKVRLKFEETVRRERGK